MSISPHTSAPRPLQLTFCFDNIVLPGPNKGEFIIRQRPNLMAECSVTYAMQVLGCGRKLVHKLTHELDAEGKPLIKARKVGRKVLVDVPSLYAYKEKGWIIPPAGEKKETKDL